MARPGGMAGTGFHNHVLHFAALHKAKNAKWLYPPPPIKNFYNTCPMFYTLRQKIPAKGLTGKRRDERKERELAFTRTSTVNY
jgi:hypothetical protein